VTVTFIIFVHVCSCLLVLIDRDCLKLIVNTTNLPQELLNCFKKYWIFLVIARLHLAHFPIATTTKFSIDALNMKVGLFILLLFASLPDCGQNQPAVSDAQHSLSDS
jgi:hypothetical protein